MKCKYCDKKIPAVRLKALPHTVTCVKCSDELAKNPNLEEHEHKDLLPENDDDVCD